MDHMIDAMDAHERQVAHIHLVDAVSALARRARVVHCAVKGLRGQGDEASDRDFEAVEELAFDLAYALDAVSHGVPVHVCAACREAGARS